MTFCRSSKSLRHIICHQFWIVLEWSKDTFFITFIFKFFFKMIYVFVFLIFVNCSFSFKFISVSLIFIWFITFLACVWFLATCCLSCNTWFLRFFLFFSLRLIFRWLYLCILLRHTWFSRTTLCIKLFLSLRTRFLIKLTLFHFFFLLFFKFLSIVVFLVEVWIHVFVLSATKLLVLDYVDPWYLETVCVKTDI